MDKVGHILKRSSGLLGVCLLLQVSTVFAVPLSLNQAVDLALEKHLDIKLAENSEEQAKDALQSTEGSQKISLDATNTFYLKQIHQVGQSSSTGLTLSLPLYTGGKNEGNVENAKRDISIAELDLVKTKQDVKLKAISAYYDALEAQKTVAVYREEVDNYTKHLDNVQAQYSVGNIAKVDVLRSEVELANAEQDLVKEKNAYDVAMNSLKNVIRWQSEDPLELSDDFQYDSVDQSMADCVALAKQNRPDLKKYQLAIEKAQKSVAIAGADKKPSVSLLAGSSWGSNILPDAGDKQTLYVGVQTSWNLFDGQITNANNGKTALDLLAQTSIDLMILDVMMPEYDGWAVCRELRKTSSIPVIMLTAKGEEIDQLFAFELGVDEYITKPFSPKILTARVNALFRRIHSDSAETPAPLTGLWIDTAARKAFNGEKAIDLSTKEYDLLFYLSQNSGKAVSREQILDQVWGYDYFGDLRTVDTHINRLRTKLGPCSHFIQTLRGYGYRFEVKIRHVH